MVFKRYKDSRTTFDIDIDVPLKFKVSLSSDKPIDEMANHLRKAMGLDSIKEVFEELLKERLRKYYPSKYDLLKSNSHYKKLENEAKFKIKNEVCEGNLSKALVEDFLKMCDKYGI